MSILNLPSSRFDQVMLELLDDAVDVLLSEADDRTVVENDVREESVRLLIRVNTFLIVLLHLGLSLLVTPLQAAHRKDSNQHDW